MDSSALFNKYSKINDASSLITRREARGEDAYALRRRVAAALGYDESQGRSNFDLQNYINNQRIRVFEEYRQATANELAENTRKIEKKLYEISKKYYKTDDVSDDDKLTILNEHRLVKRSMEVEAGDLDSEIVQDIFSNDSRYKNLRNNIEESLSRGIIKDLEVGNLTEAYDILKFVSDFARINNTEYKMNVKRGREAYRKGRSLADISITGKETNEQIMKKAQDLIFTVVTLYKDADGDLRVERDERNNYRFRFLEIPKTNPRNVKILANHRGKVKNEVYHNCVVRTIAGCIPNSGREGIRKILASIDSEARATGGFEVGKAKELLKGLPANFIFRTDEGPFFEVTNFTKEDKKKRHDIPTVVIVVEQGHGKKYINVAKKKKDHIVGDKYEITKFAKEYGLPLSGDEEYPFIVSDAIDVVIKSYVPEFTSGAFNRVNDVREHFFKSSKQNISVYDPLIDYYRQSRRYVCYRDEDLSYDKHVKVDVNHAYFTAMMQVKFPMANAESYKLENPMQNKKDITRLLTGLSETSKAEGLIYCEYENRWYGHLEKLRREGYEWYTISMVVKMMFEYHTLPKSISHVIFNRRVLDVDNFDVEWLKDLRQRKDGKKDFNTLVGSLCPASRTKNKTFQNLQDLNMFLAQSRQKGYIIHDFEYTGKVTNKIILRENIDWKEAWRTRNEEKDKIDVEEFRDIQITYSNPEDKRIGLPAYQTQIVNHVSFMMCEAANLIEEVLGKQVLSIWTDSIAYEKEFIEEKIEAQECPLCQFLEDGENDENCQLCKGKNIIPAQCRRYEDKSKRISLEFLEKYTGFSWKHEEFKRRKAPIGLYSVIYPETKDVKKTSLLHFEPKDEHFNPQSTDKLMELVELPPRAIWFWKGEAGCGKSFTLNSYNLSGVKITSAQKTVNKEFSSQTIQSATRYFPNTKENVKNSVSSKKLNEWSCHVVRDSSGRELNYFSNRNYIAIDEFTKSPHECINQAKKNNAVIILIGDTCQMYRIGEEKYNVYAQNDCVVTRPLEGNYRFKHNDGSAHDEWYELCREIRQKVGCYIDPENIDYGDSEQEIIRTLATRNEEMRNFIHYFLACHPAAKDKFIDEHEAARLLKKDKENTVVLASTNGTVDYYNEQITTGIGIGDVVRPNSRSKLPTGLIGKVIDITHRRGKKYYEIDFGEEGKKFCGLTTIRLAYAMTIASSQGLTIEKNVILDLEKIKDIRTLYVGLTRAKYIDNLKIVK